MIIAKNNQFKSEKDLKIINFYSDGCPPCHAFMPNFIDAESTFGEYFDFIIVNTGENLDLSKNFHIMGTPSIIILKNNELVFRETGIPNGAKLKKFMIDLSGINL